MSGDPWPGYKGDRPTHPEAFDAPGAVDVATVADILEGVRTWQQARRRWERQDINDQVAWNAAFHEYFKSIEHLLQLVLPLQEAAYE